MEQDNNTELTSKLTESQKSDDDLRWEELDAQPNGFKVKDRLPGHISTFNPQAFTDSKRGYDLDIHNIIGRIDERISLGKIPSERYFCLASQKDQYYRKRSLASALNATSSQIAMLSGLA